jgi:hypothetical protein
MAQEEEFNIFKAAGNFIGKKKKKKSSSLSESPASGQHEIAPVTIAPSAYQDLGLEDMLKRLRHMDTDLQKKMQRICELSGMTKKEVERYVENPNNFNESQWQKMQKQKEQLEEQIFTVIGIKAKKRMLKKKKMKIVKGHRGKTLGGRKGWIQM